MCGIAGTVCHRIEMGRRSTEAMEMAQRHRGPDDHGVEVVWRGDGDRMSVTLGSSRLAILDLSKAGHQPMHDPTTGSWIVHNGEIYNFIELRTELEAKGEKFASGTDTEVILLSYKVWGREAVHRWRGMFACAIWDPGRQEVVLMRDRLGVKPLYWATGAEGAVLFSSEVRALLASGLVECQVDLAGVSSFLSSGAVRAPATMIRNVRSLPPASCVAISARGEVTFNSRYWDLTRCHVEYECDPNAVIKVRSALQDAVETHLVSDVPVGVFLSGGVDSSAMVALASQVTTAPIKTFSVVFQDRAFSEAAFSREVAKQWGTDHSEVMLMEQQVQALIEDAVECMDQPSVDGVNTFLVSQCAKQGDVKVALSGLGGDEVFGGYSTFPRVPLLAKSGDLLGRLPVVVRGVLGGALSRTTGVWRKGGRLSSLAVNNGDILSSYLMLRTLFSPEEVTVLTGGASADGSGRFEHEDRTLRERIQGLDPFRQVSLLEMEMYLSNMLLRDTDVMSMAHSLEVRVPFLDHRLVEYIWSLPMPVKWQARKPKSLLRAAMGRDLPAKVVNRPKAGFAFPWAQWMRGELRPVIEDTFARESSSGDDVLDRRQCRRVWMEFLSHNEDRDWSRVWSLYVLFRWLDRLRAMKKHSN